MSANAMLIRESYYKLKHVVILDWALVHFYLIEPGTLT